MDQVLGSLNHHLLKIYEPEAESAQEDTVVERKQKTPDLILLDYEMPEWDGKKTLEEIRNDEELKDIPVVFVTAVADKAHIAAVLELRPSGYLLKPIEQQKLYDTIEKALIRI